MALLLTGCSGHYTRTNMASDKAAGLEVTEAFYKLRVRGKNEATFELFSRRFFEASPAVDFLKLLETIDEKLGPLTYAELDQWETVVTKGTHPMSRYTYAYEAHYREQVSLETFILEKEDDGVIRIVYFGVDADHWEEVKVLSDGTSQ